MSPNIVSKWPARGAALVLAFSLAAIALPTSASAQEQTAQAQSGQATTGQATTGQAQSNVAAVNPQQKSLGDRAKEGAGNAAERLDDLVKRAADIFNRVPCSNKGVYLEGSLPNIATKLAANEPVTIVAFGSSSTAGYGATSPIFSYPYRLADQLRRKYPMADITIFNRGIGGEDAEQMMQRMQTAVIDAKPDLVIWQVGTNIVIRGDDAAVARAAALVNEGIDKIKAVGADIVLIDPQYVPATASKETQEKTNTMVNLLGNIAHAKQIARFPRFAMMRKWHDDQKSFDQFVISDGLHMNDWGYACFAQMLGDTIIDSVQRVQSGQAVPADVLMYRPL
jgi:lysophospholipase L1-like esterase